MAHCLQYFEQLWVWPNELARTVVPELARAEVWTQVTHGLREYNPRNGPLTATPLGVKGIVDLNGNDVMGGGRFPRPHLQGRIAGADQLEGRLAEILNE